jgi:hypothetical protein
MTQFHVTLRCASDVLVDALNLLDEVLQPQLQNARVKPQQP